ATVPAWQTGIVEQCIDATGGLTLNISTPITGSAAVNFTVPASGHANLSVFDMYGRVVETLVNNEVVAGEHSINWGANIAGGIYFLRLTTSDQSLVKNCIVLP
ncbi:MAG: T9SS type A sorting domain-containing protein, partial [Candidatus Sabulitectum sp.]|nr:T9SS type A sorting domain-containing protein [Candidatus Sabulitectum sp.]